MHAIFFGLKRAYHGTLFIGREAFTKMKLTAARFDLLYALKQRRNKTLLQTTLRRVLGVSRATVSRMLISLEQLGYIRRTVCLHDRRKKVVVLTNRGSFRFARAYFQLVRTGWAQLAVDCALTAKGSGYDVSNPLDCLQATSEAECILDRFRKAYRDVATLDYPWAPEEEGTSEFDEALAQGGNDFWGGAARSASERRTSRSRSSSTP